MIWNNKDIENKKKWVVKDNRPPGYQTLRGTAEKFRDFLNSKQPDIKTIAEELSGLVDLLLVTGNRGYVGEYEPGDLILIEDMTPFFKFIPKKVPLGSRIFKEQIVKLMRKENDERWEKAKNGGQDSSYIDISAEYTFWYQLGHCEEHAALGLYLLKYGGLHPLSKPKLFPYFEEDRNEVTRDIYFSLAGMGFGKIQRRPFYSTHAFIVLVRGIEFANSIRTLNIITPFKKSKEIIFDLLLQHPEYWGENSWIADGWLGYSYPSAKLKEIMDKEFSHYISISGVEDVTLGLGDIEKYAPFHFGNLFNRVCRDYEISWG